MAIEAVRIYKFKGIVLKHKSELVLEDQEGGKKKALQVSHYPEGPLP